MGGTNNALNCSERCISHAKGCGAPENQAAASCADLCALVETGAQLLCLESQPCQSEVRMVKKACGLSAGTGGSGGGSSGGGAGGSGGSSPPTQITITGTLQGAMPITAMDGTTLATLYTEEAKAVTFSPPIPMLYEAPDLAKATQMTVVSPSLGSCGSKPSLSASNSSQNVLLSFQGTDDVSKGTPCKQWVQNVEANGLEIDFVDAPYSNGIKAQVKVKLSPH